MEKEINFAIKKGVYCNWCVDLMKKTLNQHFALKKVEVDVMSKKIDLVTYKEISPKSIIVFLKKRGYHLVLQP